MDYLWIGLCADEKLKEHIKEKGGRFLSASVSQDTLYNGLVANGVVCDSINAPQIAAYPSYKDRTVSEYQWEYNGAKHISVGFLNKNYINRITKKRAMLAAARHWCKKCKNSQPIVFVYQMHSPFMATAVEIKKILPQTRIILIVPDLPQYMDLAMSPIKKALKKIDWIQIKRYMKSVDKYVLYSRHMAEYLGLTDGKWVVMEGAINQSDSINDEPVEKKKAIMYSGVCDLRYGIPLLLDSFTTLDNPKYELWFTGTGNAVDLIKTYAEKDTRIKYFGYFPSRNDLIMKQKEACAMINMRMPNEEASAYCFPSKIFEYMLSGNPVLSFRILGIPDEYFKYLIEIKEPNIDSVVEAMKKVLEMPEEQRRLLGKESRNYIKTMKNNQKQMKRILEFAKTEE